jgi:ABC-type antimicrobial peptide transport system permease subunit
MAAFGIYGLMTYLVARRTQELGVRLALGASPQEIRLLVLRKSMVLTLSGVAMGLLASLPLPRLVTALFTDYHIPSGWILGGTSLAVALVALVSSYIPAQRASKVDPLIALRNE